MVHPDLRVKIGALELKNPVLTASGTFGYGREFSSLIDLDLLGGIVVKGVSLKPREGNPPPRIVETPCGMLNAIGLANVGLESFLKEKLPWLQGLNTAVIVNIYGHTVEEYGAVAAGLSGVKGISAIEVNISCPNVEQGGMAFGTDPDMSAKVTERVVKETDKPVIVKLSPNVTDIRKIAVAAADAGADALSLTNTLTGMAIDIERRVPKLANISGGLSGPAIRPVSLFMVHQVVRAVKIPVIGVGGIVDYRDALEFLIAGARAIQIGTANFVDPRASLDIIEGLRIFCQDKGIDRIEDVIGTLKI
ncbi:MAG: dihydroorotate dehydrogenase [Desulfobacteraceae bacterium]|uniref:Dihydroorotate dehydrogenase n=1 Tax=Candidatus Desulfacyla euxinica TaxID=2841693 RepID=A0A8J6N1C1_9DELT|nr:dihydroorotate dehydrogenase [Candidatus Desulfacyla euxinica]MBL6978965.1 dihydroorotate dehydrogenase [Desulfobacteraceae bacterium]MBL7216847.1 dihydroorotate dehydrogenase [Desulfobacteraceae bacterium]